MKLLFRFCGLLLLVACLPAWGQLSSLKISKIEIKHIGPIAVSDDLIRANIRIKQDTEYNPLALQAAIDDDVRNLYGTGLFYNIRVTQETTNGGVVLTYVVQGKPTLTEIKFQGNVKFDNAKLKKKLTSKVGEPLDERKLFTDSQEIEKMYQKAGYPGTTARAHPDIIQESARAVAVFEINEGRKVKIVKVNFVGAQAFSEKKLRKTIKTRKHWMFSWLTGKGVFKDEQFEEDEETLRSFYREQGYIDFEIKDVQFERPTPNTMVVRFIIYEGRQYKIGSVKFTFTGNKLFTASQLAESMRIFYDPDLPKGKHGPNGLLMDAGDVFTPKGLQHDFQQVEDFYGARGYIDVKQGSPNLKILRIPNTESGTIDLEFQIDEGKISYVEKIEIRGNIKTKDKVIRRELAVSPGEVFDMVKVRLSKERLEGMHYFEPGKVDARAEATDVPDRKNLVVDVEEANTGNVSLGAGFSSVDALVFFAELKQGNFDLFNAPRFTGGGQKFRLFVQLGTQRQDYEVEFTEPWLFGKKLSFDVNLFHHELNFLSLNNLYSESISGVRFTLSRSLPRPDFIRNLFGDGELIGGLSYTLQDVGILFSHPLNRTTGEGGEPIPDPGANNIPNAILDEKGFHIVSKFGVSLAYDTRNSTQLPDRGQFTELKGEVEGPFGGQKDFYKLELTTAWYLKGFAPGHVLELVGETGVADSYGSSSSVPFYERWYLGGLYTLRGFRYHSISPRQPDSDGFHSNEPIGGNTYWFASAEYSIPIIEQLRFAFFYDIGAVGAGSYSYDFSNFDDNWGMGIRVNLGRRLGSLRLDYGVPIHHDKFNGNSGQFQFGAGYNRPF